VKVTAFVGVPSWFAPPADGIETEAALAPAVADSTEPERTKSVGVAPPPPPADVVTLIVFDVAETLPAASVALTVKL
jgi:hypothetical protein